MKNLQNKILELAKNASACNSQFKRCKDATNERELLQVVKDNFSWCYLRKVITVEILDEFTPELLIEFGIYHKGIYPKIENLIGLIFCGDVKVKMLYNSTVTEMWDNSTVTKMLGNSTVTKMWDNSTVTKMWDNSTVRVYGTSVKPPKETKDNFCIINLNTKEIYCGKDFKINQ